MFFYYDMILKKERLIKMIFDNLKNAEKYIGCNPKFKAAFEFLNKALAEELPVGRYELDGAELFAFIQEYTTKLPNETQFEGHRNYIDIQCLVSGLEVMESVDISEAQVKVEYDPEKDIGFWEDHPKALRAVFGAGDFAVFYPHDLHKPGMCKDAQPAAAKKIVVKVKV